MAGRGSVRAVLHNFLGTLSSRYSDLDGYWIWGLVVDALPTEPIDLLDGSPLDTSSPTAALRRLAHERFITQLKKLRVPLTAVQSATLRIERGMPVHSESRGGYEVTVTASVQSEHGSLSHSITFFVAPHDPRFETRRLPDRRGWTVTGAHLRVT